jgi:hypothetical protein
MRRPLAPLVGSAAVLLMILADLPANPGPAIAHVADCGVPGATYDAAADECRLDVEVTKNGTVDVGHTLRVGPTGRILSYGPLDLVLNVHGDLIVDMPPIASSDTHIAIVASSDINVTLAADRDIILRSTATRRATISSEGFRLECPSGLPGRLALSAGRDIITERGSSVSVVQFSCSAGEVSIIAGRHATIGGVVESFGFPSGLVAALVPGGGPITIGAGCDLTVGDSGMVASLGSPGASADLVHLEGGCDVRIYGRVVSDGTASIPPSSPTNHCYFRVPGFTLDFNPANDPRDPRLDKPPDPTACVEIWAGRALTIDRTGSHRGEVDVDRVICQDGGRAWIDLFARGDITILGSELGGFTVHADEFSPACGPILTRGGPITVKSTGGNVVAGAGALSTDGDLAFGIGVGGSLTIEARSYVVLDTAILSATGSSFSFDAGGAGGRISVRSFDADVFWRNGAGDVRPTGAGVANPAERGTIVLQECAGEPVLVGTSFPFSGAPTTPVVLPPMCFGVPALPDYVTLPTGLCAAPGAPTADAGRDQRVDEGSLATLDGSASRDPSASPLSYAWTQLAGSPVVLNLADPVHPTFVAPAVPPEGEVLSFQLVVTAGPLSGNPDVVEIRVRNVNQAPVAEAGGDQIVAEGTLVTLDGRASYDPDGDGLHFIWVQTLGPLVKLSDPRSVQPSFVAPMVGSAGETLTFELVVSDGIDSGTDTVTVVVENVNHPPMASAGSNQTKDEGNPVMLDGTGSSDRDGDALTYTWSQIGGPAVALSDPASPKPSFTAPEVGPAGAQLMFQLSVNDGLIDSSPAEVTITVRNVNDPPICVTARPSLSLLWPPDHRLVAVRILGVTDPDHGDQVAITITGVTQDEPVSGLGEGDTSPDAVLQGDAVLLRAERAGAGNGRVYQVQFRADDGRRGSCTGAVLVGVPHDMKRRGPVDDGQVYDSTKASPGSYDTLAQKRLFIRSEE